MVRVTNVEIRRVTFDGTVSWRGALVARATSVAVAALVSVAHPPVGGAQMFAHRILLPVPLDDSTRPVGLLPGFSSYVDIERGWRSAGDDRAWDAHLGGTVELWRFTRNTDVVIGTADELVANSLKDNGFNPRGISWELSIGAIERFAGFTAELDFAHYCRHGVDDLDPPGPAYFVPGYVATQRTMSVNGPRLRLISPVLGQGKRVHLRGAVTGERYQDQWDGRELAGDPNRASTVDSWKAARGSIGADLRVDADVGRGNSLFLRASGIDVLFASSDEYPITSAAHENHRIELGWHANGAAGGVELFGAAEHLFDDIGEIQPRSSNVLAIGLRFAERGQF